MKIISAICYAFLGVVILNPICHATIGLSIPEIRLCCRCRFWHGIATAHVGHNHWTNLVNSIPASLGARNLVCSCRIGHYSSCKLHKARRNHKSGIDLWAATRSCSTCCFRRSKGRAEILHLYPARTGYRYRPEV